jgi:hypothetical protein
MKKEVAFFKDRRGVIDAKNMIALYRSLGYTDAQIKEEMLRILAERNQPAATTDEKPAAPSGLRPGEDRTG